MQIAIIDYGAGNIHSVQYALHRLSYQSILTKDAKVLQEADKVIFPGVGHANYAMQQLQKTGLHKVIPTLTQPVLGICLGMQLLTNASEEGTTKCLGIMDAETKLFTEAPKIPHMGWNTVQSNHWLFEGLNNAYFYLVHSYYVPIHPNTIATCEYGSPFSAAIAKDNFLGVQFHPEKSGADGAKIIENFLNYQP